MTTNALSKTALLALTMGLAVAARPTPAHASGSDYYDDGDDGDDCPVVNGRCPGSGESGAGGGGTYSGACTPDGYGNYTGDCSGGIPGDPQQVYVSGGTQSSTGTTLPLMLQCGPNQMVDVNGNCVDVQMVIAGVPTNPVTAAAAAAQIASNGNALVNGAYFAIPGWVVGSLSGYGTGDWTGASPVFVSGAEAVGCYVMQIGCH